MARKRPHRSLDVLWKEYFKDPSQWWDNRKSKARSAHPDFEHKFSEECLWIHGCCNPFWVVEELIRRGILFLHSDCGELCPHTHETTSFVALLRACAKTKDLSRGTQIHNDLLKHGLLLNWSQDAQVTMNAEFEAMNAEFEAGTGIPKHRLLGYNAVLGTALVDMYAKCGALTKAHQVLEELPIRDAVCWSTLIAGYVQQGQSEQALSCYEQMQLEGFSPDALTFSFVLKACGSRRAADKGKKIHDEIARNGFLEKNIVLGNALVDMYAKWGDLGKARQVLDKLPFRDVVTWSALISGYAQLGQGEKALDCYKLMQDEGISPNSVTFLCILKACGSIGAVHYGEQIHDQIVRQGLLEKDIALGSALVDMYAKCGILAKAQHVLEELPLRNVVSWTALIAGYAQQGLGEQALQCFERMQGEGFSPNVVTLVCILKACGSIGAVDKGEKIHDEIARQGLLEDNIVLGNVLVDMYAKCGALLKAQQVLEELPVQDVVSWNTLIAGYANEGQADEALTCLDQMKRKGLSPSAVTFIGILRLCGNIGAIDKGEQVHDEIARQRLLQHDVVLGTALVDMYAKCGALAKAQQVLEDLSIQDVVSWNALIAGCAHKGQGELAVNCFKHMQDKGLCPDATTFLCLLKACGIIGLVDDAQMYFMNMTKKFGITPDLEHYSCLLDVFGRTGHLDMAVELIQMMPSSDNSVAIWAALLVACRNWGDINVGRWAFKSVVQLDRTHETAYVLMADIYAAAGMQEDARSIEAMRHKSQAWY